MNELNTLTDVANLALARLGQPSINSLDDTGSVAAAVRLVMKQAIRSEQRIADWPELRQEIELAKDATDHTDGRYRYALVPQWLAIRSADAEFARYAGWLLSEADPLTVTVTVYSEDVAAWSTGLLECVSLALAILIAPFLGRDTDAAQEIRAELERVARPRALTAAANSDSLEENPAGDVRNYRGSNSRRLNDSYLD